MGLREVVGAGSCAAAQEREDFDAKYDSFPQVRWGDKPGGYDEQYWEYNHAPKHVDHKHVDTYHPPPKYHAAAA